MKTVAGPELGWAPTLGQGTGANPAGLMEFGPGLATVGLSADASRPRRSCH